MAFLLPALLYVPALQLAAAPASVQLQGLSITHVSHGLRKDRRTVLIPVGGVIADGKHLWLSGRFDDVIYRFDTTSRAVDTVAVGKQPYGLAANVYLRCANTQLAKASASAGLTWSCAGMGTSPHAPFQPVTMFLATMARAAGVLAYRAATSLNAGPTTLLLTAWQPMQPLDLASASSA